MLIVLCPVATSLSSLESKIRCWFLRILGNLRMESLSVLYSEADWIDLSSKYSSCKYSLTLWSELSKDEFSFDIQESFEI